MSSEIPLVSVLTTCFNREAYLAEAMESVLAQTFQDFEYLIIDDCSRDRSCAIAEEYARKDSRVRLHRNEANLGDYPNRNRAASLARGKYIKYVDADDIMYPTGLQVLVEMMEAHPEAGYGLCSLQQHVSRPFPILLSPEEACRWHFTGFPLFHKAPLSAIITRSAFDAVGGFPTRRMSSDYEMWLRLSESFSVLLMPDGIVWYREHGDQEVASFEKYLAQYEEITWTYLRSGRCPLNAGDVAQIMRQQRKTCRRRVIRYLMAGRPAVARGVASAAGLGPADAVALACDLACYPFRKLIGR